MSRRVADLGRVTLGTVIAGFIALLTVVTISGIACESHTEQSVRGPRDRGFVAPNPARFVFGRRRISGHLGFRTSGRAERAGRLRCGAETRLHQTREEELAGHRLRHRSKITSLFADNLAVGVAILLSAAKHPFASEFFIPLSPFPSYTQMGMCRSNRNQTCLWLELEERQRNVASRGVVLMDNH